ncbi:MAG: ArgE/DapE family deacylase [Candidatus Kariarchaeaceae archaeon]|jgi:acetylornithine deacetylase
MSSVIIDEDYVLNLTMDLIRINSVNPSLSEKGQGERKICEFIANHLRELGLQVNFQRLPNNRINVIGILKGVGAGKSLILNGHTDTVGIDGMEDPFNPQFTDGKIFGRGASDMKGGLAAILGAMQFIVTENTKLKGDVIVAFVADEEYASIGTEHLLTEYTADAAIIPEPTNLEIIVAHKGFAWIRIDVKGKSAHGSLPSQGVDAIVKAGKVLVELESMQKEFEKTTHRLLGSPSIHASLISGGKGISTYPDHCTIQVERRTLPNENKDIISNEMSDLLSKIKQTDHQFDAEHEVYFYRPALELDHSEPIVQALSNARNKVLSSTSDFFGITWWMDSALLNAAGIPTVVFGPFGEGLHANEEYVELDSIITCAKILSQTIIDFCS